MAAVAMRPPQLNLSRPAWNQGDVIDDLIEDTDRALRGLQSKAKHDGPDPKALKDAFLETSPHFQEMLQALEAFDAANVPGGATSSKYEQALFSALRTMLRECLFTKNAGLRKHHIDRVYTWFSDKRNKTAHGGANTVGNLAVGTQSPRPLVSSGIRPNFTSSASVFESKLVSNLSTHVTQARNEALDESQFASNTQQQDWKLDSDAGATRAIPERAIDPKERIQEYKMRNLRVSQMRRQGIPMEAIRAAEEAARQKLVRPKEESVVPADEEIDRKVKELWLKKREEEELERRSEQEVQEAMAWWASNRARVEEEISRRQESIRFASQTARLHSRPTSAVSTASRALSSARPMSSRPTSSRPASSRPASSRPMSARFISGTAAGMDTDFDSEEEEEEEEEDVEVIEDFVQTQPLPEKFQRVPILKAPYDGLRQSVTPAGWPLSSAVRPISARLAGQHPDATHNFGAPSLSSRPSMPARPQTANARISFAGMAAYQDARDVNLVFNSKGDAFELHGFQSPHVSRPNSAYRQSQASTTMHSPAETPRGTKHLLLPGPAEPTIRTNQLTEVDRIKRAFARTKLVCPVNVIERALVVPQDRCYAKCVEQLPRAGGHLLVDPILAAKKAAKGKKGGKGKKGAKKGGKKGGKKKKK